MDEIRTCSRCAEARPLTDFARDTRRKLGVRAVCKRCDRQATADRRAGKPRPRPGALVLVPRFPDPPSPVVEARVPAHAAPAGLGTSPAASDTIAAPTGAPARAREPVGTDYAAAAERFIAALRPPAGDADALLVRSLRGLAELADRAAFGMDPVREINACVTGMIRAQRELAATRAAKKASAPAVEPAKRLASGQF